MGFLIQHHTIVSYILIAINLFMFAAMLLMREYIIAVLCGVAAVGIHYTDGVYKGEE